MLWMCVAAVSTGLAVLFGVGWWCESQRSQALEESARKYEGFWLAALEEKRQEAADRAG